MSARMRRSVSAVGLVTAPHDRCSRAPLIEPRRLAIVVIPAAAVSVVPAGAVPVRSVSVEVDGLSGRDVRVGWVVVVSTHRVLAWRIVAWRIVGAGQAHGATGA